MVSNGIPFAKSSIPVDYNELTPEQREDAISQISGYKDVEESYYEDSFQLYRDYIDMIDDKYKKFTTTIHWQSNSQGPYAENYGCNIDIEDGYIGDFNVSVQSEEGKMFNGLVSVEIYDVYFNGYADVDIDSLYIEVDYDAGDLTVYTDDVKDAILKNPEVVKKLNQYCEEINENVREKWQLIRDYDIGELESLEEYIEGCISGGVIDVYFTVDSNGNIDEFDSWEWV